MQTGDLLTKDISQATNLKEIVKSHQNGDLLVMKFVGDSSIWED